MRGSSYQTQDNSWHVADSGLTVDITVSYPCGFTSLHLLFCLFLADTSTLTELLLDVFFFQEDREGGIIIYSPGSALSPEPRFLCLSLIVRSQGAGSQSLHFLLEADGQVIMETQLNAIKCVKRMYFRIARSSYCLYAVPCHSSETLEGICGH